MVTIQIKAGETVFLCAHEECSGYHVFEIQDDEQLVNEKGEAVAGRWILLCNQCFLLIHEDADPAHFITRETVWLENEKLYLVKQKRQERLAIKSLN